MQLYISLRREPRPRPPQSHRACPQKMHRLRPQMRCRRRRSPSPSQTWASAIAASSARPGCAWSNPARRQVLADFLTALHDEPEAISLNSAADILKDRYDAENALTQKISVADVMRLLIMSGALTLPAITRPVMHRSGTPTHSYWTAWHRLATPRMSGGSSRAACRCTRSSLRPCSTASTRVQPQSSCCVTGWSSAMIAACGDTYCVAPGQIARLMQQEELLLATASMNADTAAQWRAVDRNDGGGSLQAGFRAAPERLCRQRPPLPPGGAGPVGAAQDGAAAGRFRRLKWYLTSYCSVKAGHAFVTGNYGEAIPLLPGLLRAGAGGRQRMADASSGSSTRWRATSSPSPASS